jgi:hypothetical protein
MTVAISIFYLGDEKMKNTKRIRLRLYKTNRVLQQVRLFAALAVMTLAAAACASASKGETRTEVPQPAASAKQNNIEVQALHSTVINWNNRNMGVPPFPAWLKALIINNRQDAVRQEFSLPEDTVIRVSQAERPNREEARVLADLMFAQQVANELKRYVVTGAASRFDQRVTQTVEEITSSTKVTLTGGQKLPDFWQQVETDDNGIKSRSYVYYSVYAFPGNSWSQLVAKYLFEVVGQIPDSRVQLQIRDSFAEIDRQTKRGEERSDAEFYQTLDLQVKEVENKQRQDMARINQQTALGTAGAEAAKAQATAEANARYAAYKSGNPSTAAAASVTANDTDWVKALSTVGGVAIKAAVPGL